MTWNTLRDVLRGIRRTSRARPARSRGVASSPPRSTASRARPARSGAGHRPRELEIVLHRAAVGGLPPVHHAPRAHLRGGVPWTTTARADVPRRQKRGERACCFSRDGKPRRAKIRMWWAPLCACAVSKNRVFYSERHDSTATKTHQGAGDVAVSPFLLLEGTSRDARVRVARAFFARGSARRVARHPRRGSRATARSGGPVGRRAQATRGCPELFRHRIRERAASDLGGAMHAAMRAGVLTAASADRSSAGTRGVLRDARAAELRAARRASRREPSRRVPSPSVGSFSATRDRATAPGPGAGGRAFPRARTACGTGRRRAANDEGTSHEGNATAGAAADDDASSDAKKNEEGGREVPGPPADAPERDGRASSSELDDKQSPSSEKSPSRDSDSKPPAKPPANAGGVGNVSAWLRRVFQPARLLGLAVNGFLFLFAAQLFAQNTGGGAGGGATHLVPVSYSRFMTAVKGDDISKLTVDGTYLTWKPKQPFVIKRQGTGPLAMTEERIEVAYSAARPEDASVPYELLHKNKVEFGAMTSGTSRRKTSTRSSPSLSSASRRCSSPPVRARSGPPDRRAGRAACSCAAWRRAEHQRRAHDRRQGACALRPTTTSRTSRAWTRRRRSPGDRHPEAPEHYGVWEPGRPAACCSAPRARARRRARGGGEAGAFISVSARSSSSCTWGWAPGACATSRARTRAECVHRRDDAVAAGRSEAHARHGQRRARADAEPAAHRAGRLRRGELVICLGDELRGHARQRRSARGGSTAPSPSSARISRAARRSGRAIGARRLPLKPGFEVDDIRR